MKIISSSYLHYKEKRRIISQKNRYAAKDTDIPVVYTAISDSVNRPRKGRLRQAQKDYVRHRRIGRVS